MKTSNRIEINPKVMLGKPVIKGTRIPVYVILNLLAEGYTVDEIREEYPDIVREDVIAALYFAARMTRFDETQKDLAPLSHT